MDRILELVADLDGDEQASTQLRRELHALKGASRMMGYREVADECHLAEDLLEGPNPAPFEELAARGDQLRSLIETLAEGGGVEESASDAGVETTGGAADRPLRRREELRVASEIVDDLADRGARLRVVSVAAEGLADRIFRLAALAEGGVGERDPRQVLATLAISLRQVAMEFES